MVKLALWPQAMRELEHQILQWHPFPESDDLESAGNSTISLMTTKEEGAAVTWPRHFSKYSSYSFFDLTDIALQLAPDLIARGYKLATIQ